MVLDCSGGRGPTINTGVVLAVVGGSSPRRDHRRSHRGFRYQGDRAIWGAVAVFLVGVLLIFAQDALFAMFGAGDTSASRTSAANWYSLTQSVLSGLVAGLVAYFVLRRGKPAWPLFALAGAGPGLLLVLAEILTRRPARGCWNWPGRSASSK